MPPSSSFRRLGEQFKHGLRAASGTAARVTGRVPAQRSFTSFSDDIMLVSYPRSGNTWLRFLIGNLISREPVRFANIERIIPDIYHHSDRELRKLPRPRFLKSHEH